MHVMASANNAQTPAAMSSFGRNDPCPAILGAPLPANSALRGGVLLLGNFDGFHLGHRALVAAARRAAPGRPLGIMSCTPHPRAFFRPVGPAFQLATSRTRQKALAGAGVDFVFAPRFDAAFAALAPEAFVLETLVAGLGVEHVVAGTDFRFGRGRAGDVGMLRDLGRQAGFGTSVVAPVLGPDRLRISSTAIRNCLAAGDMADARRLLGEDWLVETVDDASGGLSLHPALCRPAPGPYFGRMAVGPCRVPRRIWLDVNGGIHCARPRLPSGLMHLLPTG